MVRAHQLDLLGWFAFQRLVQSLLAETFGPSLEAWEPRGADNGIDAYCISLHPHAPEYDAPTPVVFQVKFLDRANTPGAHTSDATASAVTKEMARIRQRCKAGKWQRPRTYYFISNAAIGVEERKHLRSLMKDTLQDCTCTIWDGNDVAIRLLAHPTLRQAHPEILGIDDLESVLSAVVDRAIVEKSNALIRLAASLPPVFVETKPYYEARRTLARHSAVVLAGPPEMGKTAIAHMLALSSVSSGWQAVVCDRAQDYFDAHRPKEQQLFVCDDAFGRTEYRPERVADWERNFPRILASLDPTHWLILTSRKHLLDQAARSMDLEAINRFPDPYAIMVRADKLSTEEKARILYKHVKHAGLPRAVTDVVRRAAKVVIADPHFTPERIRLVVSDVLTKTDPETLRGDDGVEAVRRAMWEIITSPTRRMQLTFSSLPSSHKWLLTALLDCGHSASDDDLLEAYRAICPAEDSQDYEAIRKQLTEAFLKDD